MRRTGRPRCESPRLPEVLVPLCNRALRYRRAAAGEEEQPLAKLRRARFAVGATDVGVTLLLRAQFGSAFRAVRRHHELGFAAVPQVDDRPENLGDHIAGLADGDGVADLDTFALHLD